MEPFFVLVLVICETWSKRLYGYRESRKWIRWSVSHPVSSFTVLGPKSDLASSFLSSLLVEHWTRRERRWIQVQRNCRIRSAWIFHTMQTHGISNTERQTTWYVPDFTAHIYRVTVTHWKFYRRDSCAFAEINATIRTRIFRESVSSCLILNRCVSNAVKVRKNETNGTIDVTDLVGIERVPFEFFELPRCMRTIFRFRCSTSYRPSVSRLTCKGKPLLFHLDYMCAHIASHVISSNTSNPFQSVSENHYLAQFSLENFHHAMCVGMIVYGWSVAFAPT